MTLAIQALCLAVGCARETRTMDLYLDAVMLRELGQDELAIEKLKVATEADPDFTLAFSELGRACQATGNHEGAVRAFQTAVRLDPWSWDGYMDLARAYEDLERFADAAQAYARAGELDPKSLSAQVRAGHCCLRAGQTVRALAHGEAARRIDADSHEAWLLLGRVYEAQKDYPLAIQAFRRLLVVDPADGEARLALSVVYIKNGQFDQAEKTLLALVETQPTQTAVFRHLGYCLVNLGEPDRAIQMYEKALDIDADDWQAHRGLGVAYMVRAHQTDDPQAQALALRHWRRALEINPDQPKREALERLIRERSRTMNPLQGLNY